MVWVPLFIILCSLFIISCLGSVQQAGVSGESEQEDATVHTYQNKWAVVSGTSQAPVIDGKLDETLWQQAATLGDFRTAYDNQPVEDGPEYRIAYDAANLYIGGTFTEEEAASLASVGIVIRPPSSNGIDYVAALPVNTGAALSSTNWDLSQLKQPGAAGKQVDISGFPYSQTDNEGTGTVRIEAAIPLSDLGDAVISPGDEWQLNILHAHDINTKPLLSWVPVRTSRYSGSATSPTLEANVVDEGRLGSLFFGQLLQGEGELTLSAGDLSYADFTEKQLSFEQENTNLTHYRLQWREPNQAWQTLEPIDVHTAGNRMVLSFNHPAPMSDGWYELSLLAYDETPADGAFSIISFDRDSLIAAGETMFEPAPPEESPTPITWTPASEEVQHLLSLIPEQSGIPTVGLPEKPELQAVPGLYTLSEDGRHLVAAATGTLYPNDQYPETQSLTVFNRLGEPEVYPYYEDAAGRKYFLSARLWYEQSTKVAQDAEQLASTDPLGTARLLYRFAQVQDGYVPETSRVAYVAPFNANSGPPFLDNSGVWSNWHVTQLLNIEPLLLAYGEIGKTDALQVLSSETGVDVRQEIENRLFRPAIDYVLAFPVGYHNTDPYIWRGLITAGKVLDKPDYIHLVVERMNEFLESQFMSEGFWHQTALSYHIQVLRNINQVLAGLQGYSDPVGYVSPRTGTRFDNLDLNEAFPVLDRVNQVLNELTYPDRKMLPVQDTWANTKVNSSVALDPLLLPEAGIGRLAVGQDAVQSQLNLMFTPKYGHNQRDPLNITLYANGQELLPDLGYTYTNYRQFASSTIGHNTVVVDSQDMTIGDANKDGGRIESFVPEGGLFQEMRASESAYPEAEDYEREPWFVPFADGENGEGYVLDLFRVSGGDRHEYTLQGDANHDAWFETDMPLASYGPYLLPPGTEVRQPTSYTDFGSADGNYPGYIYIRDVEKAELPDDQYQVTLATRDDQGSMLSKLRITGLLEDGDNALYLGRSPSIRATRLHGGGGGGPYDNNIEAEKYDMPKLVLRRDGNGDGELKSTFVTLMEPYQSTEQPRIEAIERLQPDQVVDGAVAIQVVYGKTTDILLSNPIHPEEPLVAGDIVLQGKMGMIRLENGIVQKMELAGGTLLRKGDQEVTGTGSIAGTVTGTLRKMNGDAVDALVTDANVPQEMIGNYVMVTHPDQTTSGYRIGDIRQEQGKTWIVLADQDPGFVINEDGSSGQVFFPGKTWSGMNTFRIDNVETLEGDGTPETGETGTLTGVVHSSDGMALAGAAVNLTGCDNGIAI